MRLSGTRVLLATSAESGRRFARTPERVGPVWLLSRWRPGDAGARERDSPSGRRARVHAWRRDSPHPSACPRPHCSPHPTYGR